MRKPEAAGRHVYNPPYKTRIVSAWTSNPGLTTLICVTETGSPRFWEWGERQWFVFIGLSAAAYPRSHANTHVIFSQKQRRRRFFMFFSCFFELRRINGWRKKMNDKIPRTTFRNRKGSWRQRSAFTLIELLVVIAIIAVLAAMLLPALSMAKNRAQTSVDINNIHQIMLAAQLYGNDNNGFLPRPSQAWWDFAIPTWCYSVPTGEPTTYGAANTVNTYNSSYPLQVRSFHGLDATGKALPKNLQCQFVPYLHNEKVLRCPADIPNTLMYERQVYISSYQWNGQVFQCERRFCT